MKISHKPDFVKRLLYTYRHVCILNECFSIPNIIKNYLKLVVPSRRVIRASYSIMLCIAQTMLSQDVCLSVTC